MKRLHLCHAFFSAAFLIMISLPIHARIAIINIPPDGCSSGPKIARSFKNPCIDFHGQTGSVACGKTRNRGRIPQMFDALNKKAWNMNRVAMPLMMIVLALGLSCANLPKRQIAATGVVKTASTIRFTGYTTTVEIKGSPEEVGKYLLDPKNLFVSGFKYNKLNYELPSPKILEREGDTFYYYLTFAGLRTHMMGILTTYKPGEEVAIFFTDPERGVLADLHLYMEPFQGGTKVRLTYENEDVSPGLQEIQETLNVHELLAQFLEWAIARGQQHFDPSLKPEDLLKKGIRGEFYDPIYDAYKETIWIQAPPKKVYEFLTGSALKKYDAEYGSWMGKLFFNDGHGPIPAKINTGGININLIGYPGQSTRGGKPGYHSTGFLVSSTGMIAKPQVTVKAKNGGTELTINYIISSSKVDPSDLYGLAKLETQLPMPIEKFLLGVKQDLEGGGK